MNYVEAYGALCIRPSFMSDLFFTVLKDVLQFIILVQKIIKTKVITYKLQPDNIILFNPVRKSQSVLTSKTSIDSLTHYYDFLSANCIIPLNTCNLEKNTYTWTNTFTCESVKNEVLNDR